MKILNIGSCNIDHVYSVGEIVRPKQTISASNVRLIAGGKGLNQSIALAAAGAEVYHAAKLGADGEMLFSALRSRGVNTKYIVATNDVSGHAIIQVSESGENSIIVYGGVNRSLDEDYVDGVLSEFDKGDMVLVQNETNMVEHIINKAYERGLTVVFNPSPFDDTIKNLPLEKVGYILVNEVEAKGLCGDEKFVDYVSKLGIKAVLTLGADGCAYISKDEIVCQPSFSVKAVDTTAAGDTFTGYFIASLSKGQTVQNALKTASAAAAISVTRAGASVSIPNMDEVEKIIGTLSENGVDVRSLIAEF